MGKHYYYSCVECGYGNKLKNVVEKHCLSSHGEIEIKTICTDRDNSPKKELVEELVEELVDEIIDKLEKKLIYYKILKEKQELESKLVELEIKLKNAFSEIN